jgi:phage FluMu protein Com
MPIRFRCSYCNRLLGIATRKAGTQTTCPHCGYEITVPSPDESEPKTDRLNLDEVEELLGHSASATMKEVAVAAPPAAPASPPPSPEQPRLESKPTPQPRPAPPSVPKTSPASGNSEERPLFESDVDEILGTTAAPEEPTGPKRPPTSGMDALSLGEPTRHITLSPQKATLLMVLVVVLMAISFAAGYWLAPK